MADKHHRAEEGNNVREADSTEGGKGRGRQAKRPTDIPAKGWRDILLRVKNQIGKDNLSIIAAGVAFYSFLAIFPALIATIMIYGFFVSPPKVQEQLQALTGILPQQAQELIGQQLSTVAGQPQAALSWGVLFSLLVALWSAQKGMKALFNGIGVAYDEVDNRGFIKLNALTLLFTLLGIAAVMISAALIVLFPVIIESFKLPEIFDVAARLGRWLVLLFIIQLFLCLIYRYGPDRADPKVRWVSWGAGLATVLWLGGSWMFSYYVTNFGNYNATYGSLAAVVIVLLWFLLTSYSILLGAEINSEMEGQTRKDSTTGPPRPMGERGAVHADRLGEKP